ncbi:MAG: TetR/AcrR family transcriptional regulator, partial [Chloroflexota bacterium]
MGRVKVFDETEVVEKALALFRRQGYEATSIRDLTAELGISSSSLYATFGDKHTLYLQTLAYHREQELEQVKEWLATGEPAMVTLQHFFDDLITTHASGNDGSGSFTLSAAVEL